VAAVVCTVGAAPVRDTVDSILASARAAGRPVEVVVVWQADAPPPDLGEGVLVLDVFPVGLSHARNVGLAASSAPVVAFVDDDEVVDREWVGGILRAFERDDAADAVFGPVAPRDDRGLPYCSFGGGEHRVFTDPRTPPWVVGTGGNMAFRRDALQQAGGFDPRFGVGGPARSAEESDLVVRLLRAGRTLAFSPEMPVYHPTKTETEHLASRFPYGFGMGSVLRRHRAGSLAARYLVSIGQSFLDGVRARDARRRRETLATLRSFLTGASSRLRPQSPPLSLARAPEEVRAALDGHEPRPLPATLGSRPRFGYACGDLVLHVLPGDEAGDGVQPDRVVARGFARGALWVVERPA
jgi:GT2 family glycosyltransferase